MNKRKEEIKMLDYSVLEKARDVLHVDFRETPLDLIAISEALDWAEKWYLFNTDLIDSSNKKEK